MPPSKHPYRSPVELVEEVARKPWTLSLRAAQARVMALKHALDEGSGLEELALEGRGWLAGQIREMESDARLIRQVAEPLTRGLLWAAGFVASFAALSAISHVRYGALFASGAVVFAAVLAAWSFRVKGWLSLAAEIDEVVKDLRGFCRGQVVAVTIPVDEAGRPGALMTLEIQPERTGLRVDPAHPATDTPTDGEPAAAQAATRRTNQ